jgi:hypothetical protein
VDKFEELVKSSTISCHAMSAKSVYIDAQRNLWPCSWTAAIPYLFADSNDLLYAFKEKCRVELTDLLDFNKLSLTDNSIKSIIDSDIWQTVWDFSFEHKKISTCARQCGKWNDKPISQSKDQFVNLNVFK